MPSWIMNPTLGLPAPTAFDSFLLLHNFNAHDLPVNLSVGYSVSGAPQEVQLPLSLAPGENQVVSLSSLLGPAAENIGWGWLELSYTDWHNGLVAALVSVSQDGEHSIRSVLNWVEGSAREGWLWRADANYNTFLGILNTDTEEARVQVSLDYYDQGLRRSYELPELTLPPRASHLLDIGAVVASGQPDSDGDLIPAGVTTGGYRLYKVGPRLAQTVTTEALVFDRQRKSFTTFYNTCCAFTRIRVDPIQIVDVVGFQQQLLVEGRDACLLGWVDATSSAFYASADPQVATVGATSGLVGGAGVGTTTVTSELDFFKPLPIDASICIAATLAAFTDTDVRELASFQISVASTPVPGETNSVVSGQSAQVRVEAIDNTGAIFTDYRGTVSFSSSDTTATLPSNYTFTASDAGSHTFDVTLKTVAGTNPTRDLTVSDSSVGVSTTKNIFVWFQATMNIEFWKNCDFVACPDLGSYFCQTAYKPEGWPQPQSFIALTQSSTSLANVPVTVRNGSLREVAFVGDAGPVLNTPYWNTGSPPPTIAGCLTDVLAGNLGIANGCLGSVAFGGPAPVLWRFGN